MAEPNITYTPVRFRKQEGPTCIAYACCALIEKLEEIKGFNVELDPIALDNNMRAHYNKFYPLKLNTPDCLRYLKEHGVEGYKLKTFQRFSNLTFIKKWLCKAPLLISITTYNHYLGNGKKTENGVYNRGIDPKGSHLACVFGYEDGNYLILDSNYSKGLRKLKEEDLRSIGRKFYFLTM